MHTLSLNNPSTKNRLLIQDQDIKPELYDALKSFIFILQFYKGKNYYYSIDALLDQYDYEHPFTSLEKIATGFNIVTVNCINISVGELKRCKYPTIINISSDQNKKHFVVCFGYNLEHGFLIIDVSDARYYVKEDTMKTIWQDQNCWAFVF